MARNPTIFSLFKSIGYTLKPPFLHMGFAFVRLSTALTNFSELRNAKDIRARDYTPE